MSELCVGSSELRDDNTRGDMFFWSFVAFTLESRGHTSDPLVEFLASDTSFAEGNVRNEASL